ncbi:MAG: hypothetical protein GWN71_26050, partial [Gammaproteobacteria bacterium]|nr:hypothetical protein [Gemmatimonadota bacterium]NIU76896.1 hypothetical protein [Gammaproteobacteria bacterium]NIX22887.1 hypothetical protein [Actinomycetota bacterium]
VGTAVTVGYFSSVLGVRAALGRTFVDREDRSGADPVVVLSHDLWRRQFGGDSDALGRTITMDGTPYTVVGVMP